MQIHELTQPRATQLTEVDLIGPNSIFNKARAAASTVKSGAGFKFRDPNNTYQKALDQQYQQAAAKAAAGLRAQGYGAAPTPAPAATTATTQAPAQTMSLGGQKLDPNNPADAQIIAKMQAAQQQPAAATTTTAATTPPQAPVTPAPAVATRPNTAGAVYTTPNTAGAIYTRPNTAGAVRPGAAQAIMTQTELNTALRQVNLSRNQIDELAKQLQANPAMAQALLKALGLAK
jgi:hypothetical protein